MNFYITYNSGCNLFKICNDRQQRCKTI